MALTTIEIESIRNVWKSKGLFQQKVAELRMLVDGCSDNDTIATVCSHLSSAICVLKATEFHKPEPLIHKRPAPNANIEHQL